jgi:hypothetical protein
MRVDDSKRKYSMKEKSGTHEEYERLGVYLKLAGRIELS